MKTDAEYLEKYRKKVNKWCARSQKTGWFDVYDAEEEGWFVIAQDTRPDRENVSWIFATEKTKWKAYRSAYLSMKDTHYTRLMKIRLTDPLYRMSKGCN
jgi:hypothetical protein